ncbi:MAG: CHAD domain-containing protein [Phycisphaerae bacterium]|jgi:CHAD domain-containing protein
MARLCDQSYCSLCAKAILARIADVRRLIRPVRKGQDADAVHDMRVASRRLRMALGLFEPCLPQQAAQWRREARRLTRALGQARDLDVQIEFVESFGRRSARPSGGPGVSLLGKYLRKQRGKSQRKVLKALAALKSSDVMANMEDSLGRFVCRRSTEILPPSAMALSARRIGQFLAAMLRFEKFIADPLAIGEHHQMRIAAKRLRYCLEIFRNACGGRLDAPIKAAKKLQTLLGELHDCDVWLEFLPRFRARRRREAPAGAAVSASESAALTAMRRDRKRRRDVLYRRVVRFWAQTRRDGTWLELSPKRLSR